MASFLLIHGSAHGAWCWHDVIPALKRHGHAVRTIDLPGHGADRTPLGEVTLERYVAAIVAALEAPAIVVAHSMAGVPMTQAAERAPGRFERLVYLCAYAPESGDSVASLRRKGPSQPLLPAIRTDAERLSFRFDPELARDALYHDCSDTAVTFALAHLGPQAILPQEEPVTLSGKAAALPCSYIVCAGDRAIPPEYQRGMAARVAPGDTYEMTTSHSPFLSDPEGLAALLDTIARKGTQT